MISQALVFNLKHEVLMVRQYVERGDIVWNFPGGTIEESETPEQACIREVLEETGYKIRILRPLHRDESIDHGKYTFLAEVIGGKLGVNKALAANDDILSVAWVDPGDAEKWDSITLEILRIYQHTYNS